jgi:flagellar biosynthetic protein FliR
MIESLGRADLAAEAFRFALPLLRAGGIVAFCPVFGSELLPARAKAAVALALAVFLWGAVPSIEPAPAKAEAWIPIALRESAVGFGLGIAARAVFSGIEAAAGLVAGQSGFALAAMVDPLSGESSVAPALFQNLLAIALFLAADLHHLFVRALVASYELLPPGSAWPETAGLLGAAGQLGSRVFALAVALAAPALVVTIAVDLVLLFVGRAVPQMQILTVGYPVKLAAGILAMILLASTLAGSIRALGRVMAADGGLVLAALAGR